MNRRPNAGSGVLRIQSCRWRLAQFRELAEFAAGIGPVTCLNDLARQARRVLETIGAGIGVGLQGTSAPGEMPEGISLAHFAYFQNIQVSTKTT
jgi:hypothetical protein